MNCRKIAFLAFLAALLAAAGCARAANCGGATACACGDTVTSDYNLASNLNCTENGLVIGANGIKIDGRGYAIKSSRTDRYYGTGLDNSGGYDNLTIQDLNITGFYTGIYVKNCTDTIIRDVNANFNGLGIIGSGGAGFEIRNSSSITLENSTANFNGYYGIYIYGSSGTLTGNTANSNDGDGISLSTSTFTLTENSMAGNGAARHTTASLNGANLYVGGTYGSSINTTNKVEGKSVYYMNGANGTAETPLVYDGDALGDDIGMFWCLSCSYIQVKNATLSENNAYGIFLKDTNNATIQNVNASSNSTTGIYLLSSPSNTLEDNNANSNGGRNGGTGIVLSSSNSNTLTGNTANSNETGGISAGGASNTLRGNTTSGNPSNFYASGNSDIDTSNKVEGKSIYYVYQATGTAETPVVYDGDVLGNDIGMFWCISCRYVEIKNATLAANNYYGIYFRDTNNSTIQNVNASSSGNYGIYLSVSYSNTIKDNTVNSNKINGIYLIYSASNTLESNTTNANNASGITLFSSPYNTLTNNTANSNGAAGGYGTEAFAAIFLESSNSNILENNTASLNSAYGLYLTASTQNTITGNTFSNNLRAFSDDTDQSAYNSNQFIYNTSSESLSFIEPAGRVKSIGDTIDFNVSAFAIDGSECNNCTTVAAWPSETVTIDGESGNDINCHFTATNSGMYALTFTVADSNSNVTKANYRFFVGNTLAQTTRYYLRGVNPIHGQPLGTDAKSMLLSPPTATEEWNCGFWIQNSPDEIPEYPFSLLSGIDINSYYRQITDVDAYIGIQRFFDYEASVDHTAEIDASFNYTWTEKSFTNINWIMEHPRNWYQLSLKLIGDSVSWQTTAAQPSYADFNYLYTTTPAIKSITDNNITLLSATALASDTNSATIVLDGNGNTLIELSNHKRAFQGYKTRLYFDGNASIDANNLAGTTTISSVALDTTPSTGHVDINIIEWNTTGKHYKKWTETGSASDIRTTHLIGDLEPNVQYNIKMDGETLAAYRANATGKIEFTHSGYSTKTFEIEEKTIPPEPTGGGTTIPQTNSQESEPENENPPEPQCTKDEDCKTGETCTDGNCTKTAEQPEDNNAAIIVSIAKIPAIAKNQAATATITIGIDSGTETEITVSARILSGNKKIWEQTSTITIKNTGELLFELPPLPAGEYLLVVTATDGKSFAEASQAITVEAAGTQQRQQEPADSTLQNNAKAIAFALLLAVLAIVLWQKYAGKKPLKEKK